MRLWSLHPRHLDRIGLIACWREALLAQAVLDARTRGYQRHPQLERFRASTDPLAAIGTYLAGLHAEAEARGYRFAADKIRRSRPALGRLAVTSGQLDYEWQHLGSKLAARSPAEAIQWRDTRPTPHPLFEVGPGEIEPWERT